MAVSLAVFGPQNRSPTRYLLEQTSAFLTDDPRWREIISGTRELEEVWAILIARNPKLSSLPGSRYIDLLSRWFESGCCDDICTTEPAAVALPRLIVVQAAQYLKYLKRRGIGHQDFLAEVRFGGGIQGFCAGLITAAALSHAENDGCLVRAISTAIRIAFVIGVAAEYAERLHTSEVGALVVKVNEATDIAILLERFPLVHVSAVNEPKLISIAGPVCILNELEDFAASSLSATVQWIDARGSFHNPENRSLASELGELCARNDLLDFGRQSEFTVPVRSNRTGEVLTSSGIAQELITSILVARCEWFHLLSNVAADLRQTGTSAHNYISFGTSDCISHTPFRALNLQLHRMDREFLVERGDGMPTRNSRLAIRDSVAIVGVSCRLPGANDLDELWSMLMNREDRHEELGTERFDVHASSRIQQSHGLRDKDKFYANTINDPSGFDHPFFNISAREMAYMDPQQRILLELAWEAMESSGYVREHNRQNGDNIGCFIGASFTEYLDNSNAHPPTAYTSTGTIKAFLCGRIAHFFGWTGPAEVIDTACSSSLVAINRAYKAIQTGECSMALAGGINLITGVNNFLDLANAGFLSPTGQCKPFDDSADGYCRSEGGALVVLKPLRQAQADGDHILAVLTGSATNQGGLSSGLTVPDSAAQVKLYKQVLQQAGIHPDEVTYVEAHGTGTQVGDPLEIASIRSVYGSAERKHPVVLGSIKGNIGHCETAAGVAGLVKIIAMLQHESMPPQASFQSLNAKVAPLDSDGIEIIRASRSWKAPELIAMVNSYGAAGSNAAVLCQSGRHYNRTVAAREAAALYPIIISAASPTSMQGYCASLTEYLGKSTHRLRMDEIAYTLSEKRKQFPYRVALTAQNTADLARQLAEIDPSSTNSTELKPIVMVFGGQSGSHLGLRRQLYEQIPTFKKHLDVCDRIIQELGYSSVFPAVFRTEKLLDPILLQSGLVCIQYAYAMTWIEAGLGIATVIGHSLGELTALAVSGALTLRDCLKLVAHRASLIKSKCSEDSGAMLSVFAERHDIEDLVASFSATHPEAVLDIACYNAEASQVVSGRYIAVSRFEEYLRSQAPEIRSKRLATSHGFHSNVVDPILPDLTVLAKSLHFREPTIPIEICVEEEATSILSYCPARHARDPVFFSAAIQRIERKFGSCVWLEAGSDTSAIPLAKRALRSPADHDVVAIRSKDHENAIDGISRAVSSLWQLSVDVTHWEFLLDGICPSQVWLPPYQFDHTSAWLDNIDHAARLRSELDALKDTRTQENVHRDRKMVTALPANSSERCNRFQVHTDSDRFIGIVAGHAVRQKPLCPASLYLECVTMALQTIVKDVSDHHSGFEDLWIEAPLVPGAENVQLELSQIQADHAWSFVFTSRNSADSERCHARGRVVKDPRIRNDAISRIIPTRSGEILQAGNTERLNRRLAYTLFSRVMSYDECFKGIEDITITGLEAVAHIRIPDEQPARDESTVIATCEAVTLDTFSQVLGLLVNSSTAVGEDEVMICSAIEDVIITKGTDLSENGPWSVYASYKLSGPALAVGDVFAFSEDGNLAVTLGGCNFQKMKIRLLENLLDAGASSSKAQQPTTPPSRPFAVSKASKASQCTREKLASSQPAGEPLIVPPGASSDCSVNLRAILAEYTGVPTEKMRSDTAMVDIDLDSIAAIELAHELRSKFRVDIKPADIFAANIGDLERLLMLPGQESQAEAGTAVETAMTISSSVSSRSSFCDSAIWTPGEDGLVVSNKECGSAALARCNASFHEYARETGFLDYWETIGKQQDLLVVSYILEAFQKLGVDVLPLEQGKVIANINHTSRHSRLVQRLWEILEKHGYIEYSGSIRIRGTARGSSSSSQSECAAIMSQYPAFAMEAQLMDMTGRCLAECLRGSANPVSILFGSRKSADALADYYSSSPMLSTMTEVLGVFVTDYMKQIEDGSGKRAWRILEVGAGTAGTTKRLLERLNDMEVQVQYTFSDISATMIARAKDKLPRYDWLSFEKLDLEQAVSDAKLLQYDMIIGTNCVHATKDRMATVGRLRQMLRPGGILVLSEVTRVVDWYDIVFGLLEGWWLDEKGAYPLQEVHGWDATLRGAGFASVDWTGGKSEESNTQRLVVGYQS